MERRGQTSRRIRRLATLSLVAITAWVVLAAWGGYAVWRDTRTGAHVERQQLAQLGAALTAAVTAQAAQTQEWKDLLLRAHDPVLRDKHHTAFLQAQQAVQSALAQAEDALHRSGLNGDVLHQLQSQHKQLIAEYESAWRRYDARQPLSIRAVDEQVRGRDRALRLALQQAQQDTQQQLEARYRRTDADLGQSMGPVYLLALLALLPIGVMAVAVYIWRALAELNRGDARTRAIYESIGDAVVVTDVQGKVESLNGIAQYYTGWTQAEAQGKPLDEVLPLSDAASGEAIASPVARVLRDGKAVPMANGMRLTQRNGRTFAIEDSASPVLDRTGKMVGVVMVFHDVSERYAILEDLRAQKKLFQQTFDMAAVGMAHLALNGKWLRVNRALSQITGYSEAELLEKSFQGITHPDDLGRDLEQLSHLFDRRIERFHTEKRYLRKDGSIVWVAVTVSLVWKEDGMPDYGISIIEDIQTRKEAELSAESARQQYRALFEQMPEGVLLIDHELHIVSHNQEALRLLGYDSEGLLSLKVSDIEANEDAAAVVAHAEKMRMSGHDEFDSKYRTRGGQLIEVSVSVRCAVLPSGDEIFQCVFRDTSEQKAAVRQIEHLAFHDPLTGLPNRRLLQDRLNQLIKGILRHGGQMAVLYLDLDHFKDVNDTLGHAVGDQLLQVVAQRLQSCVRTEDTLARVGGDEFVIKLNDISNGEDVAAVAQKILTVVGERVQIGEEELHVTPSVGIAICPQDGKDSETLLKNADAALYQAKQQGRATYRFYTAALHARAMARLRIERLLHKALERGEFELHYQPKVALESGVIVGCEALIRWNHPSEGLISPAEFIPIAEHSTLIIDIGNWVMREACQQAALWQQSGLDLQVAFNVSPRQFMRPGELLAELKLALAATGVDPQRIEIEMTESLLLDPQGTGNVLSEIRALGVKLVLDDFGTGYSSLSYLKRFPISTLKIDRSFVKDADQDPDDAEMVKTIIGMAHTLRMGLVAEGVETESQRSLLTAQGCELAQGFHFSRPLSAREFENLVRANDA